MAYNVTATFVGGAAGTRVDGNGTVPLAYLVTTMTLTRTHDAHRSAATRRHKQCWVFTAAETDANLRRDIFETSVTARATGDFSPYAPVISRRFGTDEKSACLLNFCGLHSQ